MVHSDEEDEELHGHPNPITQPLYYRNGSWYNIFPHENKQKVKAEQNNDTESPMKIRFRGINLPAKTPSFPHQLINTQESENFYASKTSISFVDRPLPLGTASKHLERLSTLCGLNLLRLSVPWEAVMHEGPGIIDHEYLTYLSELIDIAAQCGFYVLIDPHQDVWSRFTGGDGAPWWTLDVAGFRTDSNVIHSSGGAFLHHGFRDECVEKNNSDQVLPRMMWPTNYGRLVTATMFTLFFAGETYAPGILVESEDQHNDGSEDKETIQSFLQRHYLAYLDVVAHTLKDKVNVLGFNTMNEPSQGYVGLEDLRNSLFPAPLGHYMSAFDGLCLGSGESLSIPYFSSLFLFDSYVKLNEKKESVWKHPDKDIWKKVGVYMIDPITQKRLLKRPHHFRLPKEKHKVNNESFIDKFMVPFYKKVEATVRSHNERFVIFAEPPIDLSDPKLQKAPKYLTLHSNIYAWAPHWYDIFVLNTKTFSKWIAVNIDTQMPIFTPFWIRKSFQKMLKRAKESGNNELFVLLGEVGIPFDLNERESFRTNNYISQIKALERTFHAMEKNDLDYTLWNYVHDNTHKYGDLWNEEDLSIRAENRNRALKAVIRPHVKKIGISCSIRHQEFNCFTRRYQLTVIIEEGEDNQKIVIFLPRYHYKVPPIISLSQGKFSYDLTSQQLIWDLTKCLSNVPMRLSLETQRNRTI